jgi:hypothetical protein
MNKKIIFIVVLFVLFKTQPIIAQEIGMVKDTIVNQLKKKFPKNELKVLPDAIINYSPYSKKEYKVFYLDSLKQCCKIEQHAQIDALDFYKSTVGMTMKKMNDTTWAIDRGNLRTYTVLQLYKDSFIMITQQKKLGFGH